MPTFQISSNKEDGIDSAKTHQPVGQKPKSPEDRVEKRRKILVSPRKTVKSPKPETQRKTLANEEKSVKQKRETSTTLGGPVTPERSSTRLRKVSLKYADYEDVPTFTPTRYQRTRSDSASKRQSMDTSSSAKKGKKRKRDTEEECVKEIDKDEVKEIPGQNKLTNRTSKKGENDIETDGTECNENQMKSNPNKDFKQILETFDENDKETDMTLYITKQDTEAKVATVDDHTAVLEGNNAGDSQEIPIVITLEPVQIAGENE